MHFSPRYHWLPILVVVLLACKKSDNAPKSSVRFIHASPNAPGVDLAPDGQLLVGNVSYGSGTSYYKVNAGGFNVRLYPTGTRDVVLNGDVALQADQFYTIMVADSVAKLKVSVVKDDRTPPPAGKSLIRFFHLVSNGSTYDFYIGPTPLFTSRSFFDHTTNTSWVGYTSIDPGTYTLVARASNGSSTVTTFPSAALAAGKSYTIVMRGFVGGFGSQAVLMSLYTDN